MLGGGEPRRDGALQKHERSAGQGSIYGLVVTRVDFYGLKLGPK